MDWRDGGRGDGAPAVAALGDGELDGEVRGSGRFAGMRLAAEKGRGVVLVDHFWTFLGLLRRRRRVRAHRVDEGDADIGLTFLTNLSFLSLFLSQFKQERPDRTLDFGSRAASRNFSSSF